MASYLTANVIGGLGNQLFIVASAFKFADDLGVELFFVDGEGSAKRSMQWKKFFADCLEIQSRLVEKMPKTPLLSIGENVPSSVFMDQTTILRDYLSDGISVNLKGYFQNLRYLPPKSRLNELFNIEKKQEAFGGKIENTCAIHFRLGDYKTISHIHPLTTDEYYRKAITTVMERDPTIKSFLVFVEKEDENAVKVRMESFGCDFTFASNFNLSDEDEMILMSTCQGVIMANSTFSWWAAYFCDGVVTYPTEWVKDWVCDPETSLALPHWIKIQTTMSICIDVGSHDGKDAIRLYNKYGLKTYAFEPHPRFFGVTVANTQLYKAIEVLQYAVSDRAEPTVTLNESQGDQSHSILPFKNDEELEKYWPGCFSVHPSGRTFTVPQTRLDAFLESKGHTPESVRIAHLHVDAQGVDFEVLKSLGKYLACVETGVVEVAKNVDTSSYQGQQGTIATVKQYLQENGFVIEAVQPNDINEEVSCEFNIVFSRRNSD
jgi:FkbM family methyltransferase